MSREALSSPTNPHRLNSVINKSRILVRVAMPSQAFASSSRVGAASTTRVGVLTTVGVIGSPVIRFWLDAFFFTDVDHLTMLKLERQGAPKCFLAEAPDESQ